MTLQFPNARPAPADPDSLAWTPLRVALLWLKAEGGRQLLYFRGAEWGVNYLDEDSHSLREHKLATHCGHGSMWHLEGAKVCDRHTLPTGASSPGGENNHEHTI